MRGGGFTPWVTFQGTVETSTHMGLYAYLLEEQLEGILALADYLRTATRLQLVVILYPDEATSNLRTFAFVALHLLSTGRLGCIFQRNSVYSGTFLSYPEELRFSMPPENRKGKKRNAKGICLYQSCS